ncbi:50S ribosomal protein L30e-like protein [Gaertneriomyces semiglobifer]|nr:50S ribosomal protein L30e-like protein [Gaertneriomyces semiglobifer]
MAKTPKKSSSEAAAVPATPTKTKDESTEKEESDVSYETRVKACSPLAQPLASKKLTKKVLKTVKKASKQKHIRRGVKEVVKSLRKGSKGLVVIAGDISPIDVISHVPVMCEESDVAYIYVPSKEDLGSAGSTKRATSCVMVMDRKRDEMDYKELFEEVLDDVNQLNKKLITTI